MTMKTCAANDNQSVARRMFLFTDLHPEMRCMAHNLKDAMMAFHFTVNGEDALFEPIEGYRTPVRQNYLFAERKSTKARAWQSAHQYGLAIDFAVRIYKPDGTLEWSWYNDAPWHKLKRFAESNGLTVPIEWDRGHVEHPMFKTLKNAIRGKHYR